MSLADKPIFLGGLFKSGTSLLRAMVGQHSRIATGLETYWFDVDWENGKGPGGKPIEDYVKLQAQFFDLDESATLKLAQNSESIYAFVSKLLNQYAGSLNKARWAEKTPGNVRHIGRILQHWPDAKVVHIIRDPRDVMASLRQTKKCDSPNEFATMWCDFFGKVDQFKQTPT